jgi:hypothetical protein
VDLGQIDLLAQEGFYSNRSDLVRTAIRNQLARHSDVVKQTITRRSLTIGLQQFAKPISSACRQPASASGSWASPSRPRASSSPRSRRC